MHGTGHGNDCLVDLQRTPPARRLLGNNRGRQPLKRIRLCPAAEGWRRARAREKAPASAPRPWVGPPTGRRSDHHPAHPRGLAGGRTVSWQHRDLRRRRCPERRLSLPSQGQRSRARPGEASLGRCKHASFRRTLWGQSPARAGHQSRSLTVAWGAAEPRSARTIAGRDGNPPRVSILIDFLDAIVMCTTRARTGARQHIVHRRSGCQNEQHDNQSVS